MPPGSFVSINTLFLLQFKGEVFEVVFRIFLWKESNAFSALSGI